MCRTIILLLALISISIFPFFANGALQPQHQHPHGGGCTLAERAALLSFRKGITSDNTNLLDTWHGQDCCRWSGISCNNQTGHVVKLHLRSTIVELDPWGYYDPCEHDNSLFGEISPSLLSLKHLEHLDLSMNCLLGPNSQIPHLLGSIGKLRYLNLSGIPFTGRVPSQLGNLSKLRYLDLGQHGYYSGTYSADITWLMKLPFLKVLSMSGVNLSGIPNWPHTLNMIPPLMVIELSSCSLHSANQLLPHLNLTKLEKLDLSDNGFVNSLTSGWFWKVTSLKYLDLGMNYLFGPFPDTLGNMTYLQVLDISDNYNTDMMMTGNLENLCSLEIIDLSSNLINGDIAVLTDSLLQCTWKKLNELDLRNNNFTGTFPNLTGKFSSLSMLDLSENNLNGNIPPEISSLTNLMSLDLSNNNFYGSLVPEIGAFTNLTYLNIRNNLFSGSVPSEIGTLTNLISLDLANNSFHGSVPTEIGALTHLTFLNLSNNKLNGSVPTEISYLSSLISLDLSNNNFSGMVKEEHFTGLKSLKNIDLSLNSLKVVVGSGWLPPFSLRSAMLASCEMGPLFPAWLQWQPEITKLDISSTTLKGSIPDWFWSTFSQATYLDISNNQLCGSLPADLDAMAFKTLSLSSNRLTGPVPSLPKYITNLDISNNSFSGKLPSNIGGPNLKMFLMYSNQIDGYIPESMCKLQSLLYLDLSNNILKGEIPQCFCVEQIQFLLLSNNSLSGKFPAFLQNSTDLTFLDLASNKFSGRLPTWIGELGALRFVLLSHNALSGTIPVEITNLWYLQFLDLSDNNFSGPIPLHLSNLTYMGDLQESFLPRFDRRDTNIYQIGANLEIGVFSRMMKIGVGHLGEILSVITKGQKLIYGKTIAYFVNIDLSRNSLTGEIPTDIASLAALMNLNLSSNQLSGKIPNMIGDVQSLVSLDLSQNNLSGEIPSSLSNLTSLSYMNLSYNSLSGRIPSGRQLDTLNLEYPSLMYIGNSGLCGPPVDKNCSGNDPSIHGHVESSKEEFDPLTFYFGLLVGFVVGLWMVFCALLFKKTWRIAYFRLLDMVYDQVYVFVVVKWASFARKTDEE